MTASKEVLRQKYEGVSKLLNSEEWSFWVDFLKGRQRHFQDQVNAHVRNRNLDQAVEAMILMDDSMEQIKLFTKELNTLGENIRKSK